MTTAKPIATRQAFGEALASLGERYSNVVVLEADLAKSTRSELFGERFPGRYFDLGIAEQNMVGVASGLALSGKTAFCCSFACFVAGRFETIRMSVAYAGANVTIVGTHAGVGIGPDGYSQMGLEDIALMRSLSGMSVFQPADDIETAQIMEWLCSGKAGPSYLRLTRQNLTRVHNEQYRFKLGGLDVLHEGNQVAIFATGGTVMHAVQARELLKQDGIDAAVVNVPCIKPLNPDAVRAWAKRVPHIVTVEDHSVLGGMGGAVSEIVAETGGAKVTRHGIYDVFGESGSPEDLYAHFKLDAAGIREIVASKVIPAASR